MSAVAKLCVVYKDRLDDLTFKEKLGAVSIKQLTRTAKERRPGSAGYAEAMILEYNGKKKNPASRLPISKLYAKDISLWIEPDEDEDYEDPEPYEKLSVQNYNFDDNQMRFEHAESSYR